MSFLSLHVLSNRFLNGRRLWALCRKESYQIVRDPSSILIAFIMPVVLLFILGYAVNLDSYHVPIGVFIEDQGAVAQDFWQTLLASPETRSWGRYIA